MPRSSCRMLPLQRRSPRWRPRSVSASSSSCCSPRCSAVRSASSASSPDKPAGLRTNILICVGAALFTQLSIDIAQIGFTPDGRPYGDTTRIAAQIVSGHRLPRRRRDPARRGRDRRADDRGDHLGRRGDRRGGRRRRVRRRARRNGAHHARARRPATVRAAAAAKRRRVRATLRVKPGVAFDRIREAHSRRTAFTSSRVARSSTTPTAPSSSS